MAKVDILLRLLLAILLFSVPADAAPKWLKRTVEYAVYAAPVVTAALATNAGHVCRQRNGVEPCTAHYGEFGGTEGVRMGVSLTFSGLSMFGHKEHYKEWCAPALGMFAFNSYWAYRQRSIHLKDK